MNLYGASNELNQIYRYVIKNKVNKTITTSKFKVGHQIKATFTIPSKYCINSAFKGQKIQ